MQNTPMTIIFVLNIYCVLYWCVVYVQYYKSLTKCSRLNSTKKQKLFNTGQKKIKVIYEHPPAAWIIVRSAEKSNMAPK